MNTLDTQEQPIAEAELPLVLTVEPKIEEVKKIVHRHMDLIGEALEDMGK